MADPRSDPNRLRTEPLICARCGACREVCPVYGVVGWESSSPGAKMSILRRLLQKGGLESATENEVEALCRCTLCGACRTSCATLIDTTTVWLETREALASGGKAPAQYGRLAEMLTTTKNVASFDNEERLVWAEEIEDEAPVEKGREGAEVLYYVGCLASFYPRASETAIALAELLTAAEVDFTCLGGEEWCCGFPLAAAGFAAEAAAVREHNREMIIALRPKTVVTACPSCFLSLSGESGPGFAEAGIRVQHVTQYLLGLIKDGRLRPGEMSRTVAYHDPCDLGRNGGIYDEPRQILEHVPGLTVVELEHSREEARCCGGGGNLQSVDPQLTERIADERVTEIVRSGADLVVSACPQCEQTLEAGIRRRALSVRVMDVTELLLECTLG